MSPRENPHQPMAAHYEKTRLPGRPFIVGTICFFVFMAVIYGVVSLLLQRWAQEPWPFRHAPAAPSADARWDIRAPQIPAAPAMDLAAVRQAENQRLHARHWNDTAHAYATIPIEDAMQLMAGAAAKNQLGSVLPAPQPATPIQLQDQKSREASPPPEPTP